MRRDELIWIVGTEPQNGVTLILNHDRVSPHWSLREVAITGEESHLWSCPFEDLELMAMKMEGVETLVMVIDNNFDYLAVFDHVRVHLTIHYGIRRVLISNGQGGVQRWDLLRQVGHVVDDEPLDSIDGR